ncbi:MAG: ubiquitin-activating E1 FCCH domain-containing protein [Hyphomonas sp.]
MPSRIDVSRRMRLFAPDTKGNMTMLFALACLALLPLLGFAINLSSIAGEKHELQLATDAAALAASHDPFMSSEDRLLVIEARLRQLEDAVGTDVDYTFSQDEEGRISLTTSIKVKTFMAYMMGREDFTVTARSDAVQGGADIEVAVVLDITGSMAGSRITALKAASKSLVDIVVKDDQTPYYSKVSLVPYAVAVNVGPYAEAARGPVEGGRPITAASWQVGAQRAITNITRANPAVVTSAGHGFINGDRVWISGVSGMTAVNNQVFTVASASANTFSLAGINSSAFAAYTAGGIIRQCRNTQCEVQVTANGHGLSDGDHVHITGVSGMTQINRATHETWAVSNTTADTYTLNNSVGPNYGAYTSGGNSFCTKPGCQFYRFTNVSSSQRLHPMTSCATERTGSEAYTDVAASTAYVGRAYLSPSNGCPSSQLIPLTADKNLLKTAIDNMALSGSTAGHIGLAWGFYALSPTFGAIFPEASRPATFGRPKLHKFVVFMTDGELNSAFCRGVLSSNSYNMGDRINCTAENGTSFAQAAAYCTAIKQAGITIYTVGLSVSGSTSVRTALINCASSPQTAYFASGSAELVAVFEQIGREINEVRLVR